MTEPQAGEWWTCKGTRVRIVGLHSDGDWVCEIESGELRVLPLGASWQHLPDCTGWDWQPEGPPLTLPELFGMVVNLRDQMSVIATKIAALEWGKS